MNDTKTEKENQDIIPERGIIKTSRLAIAAFVLSIIGFIWPIIYIIALILGVISIVLILKNKEKIKGKGLAIASIIIAIVSFIIISQVMLKGARIGTQEFINRANLNQFYIGLEIYAQDNNDKLPDDSNWPDGFIKYISNPEPFYFKEEYGVWAYALNKNLLGANIKDIKPNTVLLFEAIRTNNGIGGPEILDIERCNGKGINIVFADGSLEFVNTEDIATLKWEP